MSNGAARFIQLMKQHGYNQDVTVELAKVVSPPPSLSIRMDGDGLILDADDIIMAEHLAEHSATVTIASAGISNAEMVVKSPIKSGDSVVVLNSGQTYFVIDKAVM